MRHQYMSVVAQVYDSPEMQWIIIGVTVSHIGYIESVRTEKEALEILEELKDARKKYNGYEVASIRGYLYESSKKDNI